MGTRNVLAQQTANNTAAAPDRAARVAAGSRRPVLSGRRTHLYAPVLDRCVLLQQALQLRRVAGALHILPRLHHIHQQLQGWGEELPCRAAHSYISSCKGGEECPRRAGSRIEASVQL